ncbi:MAG: hypothetical protein H0W64_05395 [Gammaproteobacteria bacterium]|nr:hypothetical protein [Gammaproteobacteria bacterium]
MIFDKLIGNYILPAQHSIPKNIPLNIEEEGNSSFSNFMVSSVNGAELDTLIIRPNHLKKNSPYVVYLCGMRGSYTHKIKQYQQRAEQYGHTAICFNYTNVGNSTGEVYNEKQLINDGKAQVQRLLDLNIPANKITLYGLSLGGAIATLIVSQFQKRGLRIRLINDRSFSKLSEALPQQLQKVKPILSPLLKYFGWELNAAQAMQFINKEDIFIITSKEDQLIPYRNAALYQTMKPEMKKLYENVCYKKLTHSYKISNGIELNEPRGNGCDPESKYGVHGALLEKLIDKDKNRVIESVFKFVRS